MAEAVESSRHHLRHRNAQGKGRVQHRELRLQAVEIPLDVQLLIGYDGIVVLLRTCAGGGDHHTHWQGTVREKPICCFHIP